MPELLTITNAAFNEYEFVRREPASSKLAAAVASLLPGRERARRGSTGGPPDAVPHGQRAVRARLVSLDATALPGRAVRLGRQLLRASAGRPAQAIAHEGSDTRRVRATPSRRWPTLSSTRASAAAESDHLWPLMSRPGAACESPSRGRPSSLVDAQLRRAHHEPAAPLAHERELLHDLVPQVPGQDEDQVGLGLADGVRRAGSGMCDAGQVVALLVRVEVARVLDEVRADAAVVEQRVALGGRAVAGDPAARRVAARSESRAPALGQFDALGEPEYVSRRSKSSSRSRCRSSAARSVSGLEWSSAWPP